ncbi:MAG: hypothetical protein JWO94_3317, partial [Verrucomicrobiaceae bacterium]|nr:hypothetical protein [Verrucomicrobiaceae bacterium]
KCAGTNATAVAKPSKQYVKTAGTEKEIDSRNVAATADLNWTKTRFFILDTGVMEGYACSNYDDKASCDHNNGVGPNGSGSTTTAPTAGSSIPTGTTIELAKQIIAPNSNITFQTPQDKSYFDQVVATGKQTPCGSPTISPTLLGVLLTLSKLLTV